MLKESPLRKWRLDRRFTLAEIAIAIGISKSYLCEIERGKKTASVAVARKIAKKTGLSLDEFLQ